MRYPGIPVKACFSILLALFNVVFAASLSVAAGPPPLHITRITPSGTDVPAGRQIVFQFDRPVVPMGRMARKASEIPITITPPLKCQWRWLNSGTLACQLDEKSALNPATRYTLIVNPGIKAEDGTTLEKPVRHSFITLRPGVRHVWFKTWTAPGMPVIRLTFNQPVFKDSVAQHIFIAAKGKTAKLTGVVVAPDPDIKEKPLGDSLKGAGKEARRVWLVYPSKALPLNTQVALRVNSGLSSFLGPESGIEKRVIVSFATFPPFAFEGVECIDNGGKTLHLTHNDPNLLKNRCNPLRQVALVFSSPVIPEEIKAHVALPRIWRGGVPTMIPGPTAPGFHNSVIPIKRDKPIRSGFRNGSRLSGNTTSKAVRIPSKTNSEDPWEFPWIWALQPITACLTLF